MRYQEFFKAVRDQAEPEERGRAEQAIQAALATLGERIYRADREDLAAQLPDELKEALFARVDGEATRLDIDPYSLEEFYTRVSARCDVGYSRGVTWARRVMTVLRAAVTPGILQDILEQLPEEYAELFGQEPEGPASPSAV
jgi:uncharacterized protein (DUF2267 family)